MNARRYLQLDVFAARPGAGNPLGVVLDADGLDDAAMQAIAAWLNLSETVFFLPPEAGADYRIRIFTPKMELPFAGHPTLGSCHAWLQAGGKPQVAGKVVQECGVGLVTLRQDGDRLAFAAPALIKSGPLAEDDVALIARGLGVDRSDILHHAWCDNGPNWRGVMLRSAEQVLALKPDASILGQLDVGVVGPAAGSGASAPRGKVGVAGSSDAEGIAFEVRAFFPGNNGLAEDPVTGSLNAALAQWLIGAGLAPTQYVAAQGSCLGRAGRVYVQQDGDTIWVGGSSVTCVSGEVLL